MNADKIIELIEEERHEEARQELKSFVVQCDNALRNVQELERRSIVLEESFENLQRELIGWQQRARAVDEALRDHAADYTKAMQLLDACTKCLDSSEPILPAMKRFLEVAPERYEVSAPPADLPFFLGRRAAPDSQDSYYPMESALKSLPSYSPSHHAEEALRRGWRYWWTGGWWGDQGFTPQCVAYAWLHLAEDGPVTQKPTTPGAGPITAPLSVYRYAQRHDEWAGESYDGTSVRAGAKALQSEGIVESYWWARSINEIVRGLLTLGPAVMGSWWYSGMFYPDDDGLIEPTGEPVGGHAYVINGVNIDDGLIRLKNSWGRSWGDEGFAYMTLESVAQLLDEWGEVCFPIERRREPRREEGTF